MTENQGAFIILMTLASCGTIVGLYALRRHYNTLKMYIEKGYTQKVLLGCSWTCWVKTKEQDNVNKDD